MYTYLIRRILFGIPVIIGVMTLVFFSLHLSPGDPVELLIPPDMPGAAAHEIADQIRARYGLDQPLHIQYFSYVKMVLSLDFGNSIRTGHPVATSLLQRFPATLELTIFSLTLGIMIGIPSGIIAAVRQNSIVDSLTMTVALLGVALPNFWIGLLLMLLFSLNLGWLPVSGRGAEFFSWQSFKHLILPGITLGISTIGILARLTRSAMLDVLKEDYIRTARAKGLSSQIVIYRHALKNALIPVVTILGLQFGALLAGAVIVETIFAWPGIGRYMVYGITGSDFPVVQGGVLFISISFVFVNLMVDFIYIFLDPRITYQ